MRRHDLGRPRQAHTHLVKPLLTAAAVIPYREPTKDKNEGDMSSTMASTLPMAAVRTPTGQARLWFTLISFRRCSPETSVFVRKKRSPEHFAHLLFPSTG